MGEGLIKQWLWLAYLAAINNLSSGMLFLVDSKEMLGITPLYFPLKVGVAPLTVLLLFSSVMVLITPTMPERIFGKVLVILAYIIQVVLVLASAAGSVWAIIRGAYLDGTVVASVHISGDQKIYIFLALIHVLAVVEILWLSRKKVA